MFSALTRAVSGGGAARSAVAAERIAASSVRRQAYSFAASCANAPKFSTATSATAASVAGASAFRQHQKLLSQCTLRRLFQTRSKSEAAASTPSPSPGMLGAILAFPKAQPFAFNIIIATIKTSIADIITQVRWISVHLPIPIHHSLPFPSPTFTSVSSTHTRSLLVLVSNHSLVSPANTWGPKPPLNNALRRYK